MLCAVKGFKPQGLLVYRLCLPPDTPIILYKEFVHSICRGVASILHSYLLVSA